MVFSFNHSASPPSSSFFLPTKCRSLPPSKISCFFTHLNNHESFPLLQVPMDSSPSLSPFHSPSPPSSLTISSAPISSMKRGMKYLTRLSFRSLIGSQASAPVGSDSMIRDLATRASSRRERRKKEEEEGEEEKVAHLRKDGTRRFQTNEEIHFEALKHYNPDYEESGYFAGPVEGRKNSRTIRTHENADKDSFNGSLDLREEENMMIEQNKAIANDRCYGSSSLNKEEENWAVMNKTIAKDNIDGSLNLNQEDNHRVEMNGGMGKDAIAEDSINGTLELNQEQKVRAELNKAIAIARRNSRQCNHNFSDSQAQGLPFPKLKSLLVEKSWLKILEGEFEKPYMERLHQFLSQEAAANIPIYPPPPKLFNVFNSCPFDKVKVVIIGQDPYHKHGQAMGLCFSVESGMKLTSSLTNIFLEIESDLGCKFPTHGNLEKWVYQGVLLMNTVLTVRDGHANSHAKKGWELFTDAAIRALAQHRSGLIFLLWGNSAQDKIKLINRTSHHILTASHPSGHSARKGFFKCRHFSKTNEILVNQGLLPIDWQL